MSRFGGTERGEHRYCHLRRVPPHQIYGLKLRAAYADEWVWYEANEARGRDALKWGIAQIAAVAAIAHLSRTSA